MWYAVVKFCNGLPKCTAGENLANQLLRNGTLYAANYAEALGAKRDEDLVHKLKGI